MPASNGSFKNLTLKIVPEDDWYRAVCIELNISATGYSVDEAQKNLSYILESSSDYIVRHRDNGLAPEFKAKIHYAEEVLRFRDSHENLLEIFVKK